MTEQVSMIARVIVHYIDQDALILFIRMWDRGAEGKREKERPLLLSTFLLCI